MVLFCFLYYSHANKLHRQLRKPGANGGDKNVKGDWNTMKKLLAMILALVLALGCVSFAAAEEKVTLKLWVLDSLRIEDWNTNLMTNWLEEQGGFELEFEAFPSAEDYMTKINMALIAGNIEDLPDVILTQANLDDYVWEWAQAGAILPLTEYYADPELAENINKAIERCGTNYPQQITSPDGNIYGVATLNQSYTNENPDKAWYSQKWLAQLGMELPTTPDELYEVLKAVKNTDLNGNGKNDEIGLAGTFNAAASYNNWFNYLMNAFVYAGDANYRFVENGVLDLAYATEDWKEGLKFMKKLFDEGLIMPETLTMDNVQFENLTSAEEDLMFMQVWFTSVGTTEENGRGTDYKIMAPLKDTKDNLQYASFVESVANIRMVVTANCKNPEAAFKLGDLMSSEYIGISQRWGLEGQEWDYCANIEGADEKYAPTVAGFPLSIVTYHDGDWWGGEKVTNESWRQVGPFVRHYGIVCGWAVDPSATIDHGTMVNEGATLYQEGGYNPEENIPKLIFTEEEAEIVGETAATLKSYVDEMTASFLTGTVDIDAGWDAFQDELKAIGIEEYREVLQSVYDRMYK